MEKFASACYTAAQLNTIVELLRKQGGKDAVERFLRHEISVSEPVIKILFVTQSGIPIYDHGDHLRFTPPTSDGTIGPEWIDRLEGKNVRMTNIAKGTLYSNDFKPTNGVTTEVAIIKGSFFENQERITENIHKTAIVRNFQVPNTEIACLICEMFTYEEIKAMGLNWIVTMHEPIIKDSSGVPNLLGVSCDDNGYEFCAYYGKTENKWESQHGFLFSVSQNAQN